MKIPLSIAAVAAVVFVALGVACVLLDFEVREMRIDAGSQEEQINSMEAQNLEIAQNLQVLEDKRERLERVNQDLRKQLVQKQTEVQTQQDQINQGAALAQQIAPNLLHDMAEASVKNDKLRQLLTKHGYTVQSK
jgi:hypothetical protein